MAHLLLLIAGLGLGQEGPEVPAAPAGLSFSVIYPAGFHPGPISARVYVMLGKAGAASEPRLAQSWYDPPPLFAIDAKGWEPGEPLTFDDRADGFPARLSHLAPGHYAAQAVIRLNPDAHDPGSGEGNAFGMPVRFEHDPARPLRIPLVVDKQVPPRKLREAGRIKLVEFRSEILSRSLGREVRHRAAVILPEGAVRGRLPALYIIPGFGGDHLMAPLFAGEAASYDYGRGYIKVVLDPDCGTGHHVFADSPRNGPRGEALVKELVPHIDAHYPTRPEPDFRLLNGHSSGGWSSLWLAIRYPETFSATWSTAPDPVDFRDFCGVNLYETGANVFVDGMGRRRSLGRRGDQPLIWTDAFSKREDVLGDGGQLHSFEAAFSPLGPGGRERPLFDRGTGAVIPEVADAWKARDIRMILERDWGDLGPKLLGRLHVYTGDRDTFRLEGSTRLLKESLARLGSDAVVELFPGKDHFNLLDRGLAARIDREMKDWVARAEGRRDDR